MPPKYSIDWSVNPFERVADYACGVGSLLLAVSNGEIILIVFFVAVPVAGLAFVIGAGNALRQVGKGGLSVEFESDMPQPLRDSDAESASAEVRKEELRQMLEAKAYRQRARGETPVDVEAELERLLAEAEATPAPAASDAELREEVRQLVVARNQRRERQGKEPLDVEAEVARQLQDLEGMGQ